MLASITSRIDGCFARIGVATTPWAWLTHIPWGWGIQLVVALPLYVGGTVVHELDLGAGFSFASTLWLGAMVSIGHWYGRKKFEYEKSLAYAAGLHSVARFWHHGLLPTSWPLNRQWELYAPAIANIALAMVGS